MKFYFTVDNDNYINKVEPNEFEGSILYDKDNYFDWLYTFPNHYKYENEEITLDETKRQAKLEEINAKAEEDKAYFEAQFGLKNTDYIMDRCVESLLDCTTLVQFLKVFSDIKKQYSEKIAQRKEWRKYLEEHKK